LTSVYTDEELIKHFKMFVHFMHKEATADKDVKMCITAEM